MNKATKKQLAASLIGALDEVAAKIKADAYSFDCSRCENTGKNLAGNVGETCWTCGGQNIGTRKA